ncbi:hypothetical protein QJS04_geneDACA009520 [Acorus gramineus]|uniref:Dicer-like 3 n=1 Tax=Acorus gramineus TaxID=55184 RepID=A0AAV9AFP9_ACOGR|nr:hypothetical protein QJS04_geneDACA009520 [Acorus gramineus]
MDSPQIETKNPLKGPFEDVSGPSQPKAFIPRSYQKTVFDVAVRRNTIAVLETGAGKTMIAVMLMEKMGEDLRVEGVEEKRRQVIVFLAPTVHLVNQQYEVIKVQTDLDVAQYYGAKGVDTWGMNCWEKEISDHQVLVMTPQILLDGLRYAFLSLDMVRLLIFDECHRACGNHPYTRIMKEFYHKSTYKPSIFGMTASPVVRKGVSSVMDCEDQISELESILDSKIYSPTDRTELEIFVPPIKEIIQYYDPKSSLHRDLKIMLEAVWAKAEFDASVAFSLESSSSQYSDTDNILNATRKRLSNYLGKISYCLDELGLYCAAEAAHICLETVRAPNADGELSKASLDIYSSFLEEVLSAITENFPMGHESLLGTEDGCLEATRTGYLSPKLYELMQIFKSFGEFEQVLCLIFVERIITAKVIERFVKNLCWLSHFSVSYLTGGGASVDALTPRMQRETLDSFRRGEVNLLFTTDVAEEGIHVPNCSCVIRFDLPKTVRSYVQSRGRARQVGSTYFIMLERGNKNHRDLMFDLLRSKNSMFDTSAKRNSDTCIPRLCTEELSDVYCVKSTGAIVTLNSSISVIRKYCDMLPKDKYFKPKPILHCSSCGGYFEWTLSLPPNAAFQTMVGPPDSNSHIAKQLVCLNACKKLHEMGALDDRLRPIVEERCEIIANTQHKESSSSSGAGTTKRKELHGTVTAHALSGTLAHKDDGVTFQAYKINFTCDQPEKKYSAFVLLIEDTLHDDVTSTEIDLHLVSVKVKTSISPCGHIHLVAQQVKQAMSYQELFFNGLFGRLFVGSNKSREFILKDNNQTLWTSANTYLLLPLESTSLPRLAINWKGIQACASAVQLLRDGNSLHGSSICSSEEACNGGTPIIHLANKSVHSHDLKEMVVMAIHTGRIYSILDVMDGTTSESPFEGNPNITFKDYFHKKYKIVLQHPKQQLVLLKQGHNPHNLLSMKDRYEGDNTASKTPKAGNKPVVKQQCHAQMPPELLLHVDLSIDVLRSFYLFPSVMHRLESLILASQLRDEIACHFQVSCNLILEAITTMRCCEDFSLERLELLGDSVLKYAVSSHLFLNYSKKHEGQLSSLRSQAVCNATLHKLATERNLQGYIRDGAFDPRRWVAPGHRSLRPVACNCGVDTAEVPLESKYTSEDNAIVVSKSCDRGHRWICSKTIADCAEALIGAYYVGGGLNAAIPLMKWLGIAVDFEPELVDEAIRIATLRCYLPKASDIEILEFKLRYSFSVRGLLLEAITHASEQESGSGYCYQRLEFLGDAVLDLLITRYLYQNHADLDPGELTDLRSASVNNENFARAAVKYSLQVHLQHKSQLLLQQISEYVRSVADSSDDATKGPKALGDLVESIAGAILIDTKLDIERVWETFEPLLSPIVTPDKLELPPLRELQELCSHHGYFMKSTCTNKGESVVAELTVQLIDDLLVRQGCDKSRKVAKGQAAALLLKDLKERGFVHTRYGTKRKHPDDDEPVGGEPSSSTMDVRVSTPPKDFEVVGCTSKKQKTTEFFSSAEPSKDASLTVDENHMGDDSSTKVGDPMPSAPVISIKMQKGGPRIALFELCKRSQWPSPSFEAMKQNSGFVSDVMLHLPNSDTIKVSGEARADKKSSQDSAALALLRELERRGQCVIASL